MYPHAVLVQPENQRVNLTLRKNFDEQITGTSKTSQWYVLRNGCPPCSSEVEGRRAFDELEAKHTLVEIDRCFHGLALERDVVQADEREGSRIMLIRAVPVRILFIEIHGGFTGESPTQVTQLFGWSGNRGLISESTTLLVQAKRQIYIGSRRPVATVTQNNPSKLVLQETMAEQIQE